MIDSEKVPWGKGEKDKCGRDDLNSIEIWCWQTVKAYLKSDNVPFA